MVLPLVECQTPYVQYDLVDGVLTHVRQSREGDVMDAVGFSDVGVFALSVPGLLDCWKQFVKESVVGAQTNELNFLPFLPFLSQHCKWNLRTVIVSDPVEALGINTPEDLQITREALRSPEAAMETFDSSSKSSQKNPQTFLVSIIQNPVIMLVGSFYARISYLY